MQRCSATTISYQKLVHLSKRKGHSVLFHCWMLSRAAAAFTSQRIAYWRMEKGGKKPNTYWIHIFSSVLLSLLTSVVWWRWIDCQRWDMEPKIAKPTSICIYHVFFPVLIQERRNSVTYGSASTTVLILVPRQDPFYEFSLSRSTLSVGFCLTQFLGCLSQKLPSSTSWREQPVGSSHKVWLKHLFIAPTAKG